jgi:molecular chaperone DnaJ
MASINEAWQVLGDSNRRREYDLSLRQPTGTEWAHANAGPVVDPPEFVEPAFNPLARYQDPPRFPWRFMGVLALLGIVLVSIGVITAPDPIPPRVDNVLQPGDCVVIEANGDAERLCSEPHDGVVELLVPTGETCSPAAEPHRDRQGMGTACVLLG